MSASTWELGVTGFGPFGEIRDNPAEWLARRLERPCQIVEVRYSAADEIIEEWRTRTQGGILMLGVNPSATQLHVEICGRNQIQRTPDNSGVVPAKRIARDGPSMIPATLWPPRFVSSLADSRVCVSRSAGAYLCNYLSYRALCELPQLQIGFLHVPPFAVMAADEQLSVIQHIASRVERYWRLRLRKTFVR